MAAHHGSAPPGLPPPRRRSIRQPSRPRRCIRVLAEVGELRADEGAAGSCRRRRARLSNPSLRDCMKR
jgi:hypothetical protein